MKTAVVLRPLFIFDDGILRGAWLQVVISHRRSPTLFVDFFFFSVRAKTTVFQRLNSLRVVEILGLYWTHIAVL